MVLLLSSVLPAQSRRRSPQSVNPKNEKTPVADFQGTLKAIDNKEIVVLTEGGQDLVFVRSKKTKFFLGTKEVKPEELAIGEHVTVEGYKDNVGDLRAENVIQESAPKRP